MKQVNKFLAWANQDKKHQLYATIIGIVVFFAVVRLGVAIFG